MNATASPAATTRLSYPGSHPSRRAAGWAVVVGVHLLIGYALVSGTARKGLEFIQKPLQAVVIQEVTLAPPPPPKEIKLAQVPKLPKVQAPPQLLSPPSPSPPPAPVAPAPFLPMPEVTPPAAAPIAPAAATSPAQAPIAAAPPTPSATSGAKPKLVSTEIGLVCPTQVKPQMPSRALRDGIEGVVKAQALIANGLVKEVAILSGPSVFHSSVREAMLKYRCDSSASEVLATQQFVFKVE